MPHVPYWLIEQGGQVMSACACLTNDLSLIHIFTAEELEAIDRISK